MYFIKWKQSNDYIPKHFFNCSGFYYIKSKLKKNIHVYLIYKGFHSRKKCDETQACVLNLYLIFENSITKHFCHNLDVILWTHCKNKCMNILGAFKNLSDYNKLQEKTKIYHSFLFCCWNFEYLLNNAANEK